MKVLVVNWQDWTHPLAGGAEFHLREVFSRIARAGHRVDLLCCSYPGAEPHDHIDGINVLRHEAPYPLFNYAVPSVFRRSLHHTEYDVVVDDINKVPFFTPLFARAPVVALVHHLMGRTAFAETNPAFAGYVWLGERPLGVVYRRSLFIAVSPSTADDLVRRGVDRARIAVVPNGVSDRAFENSIERQKSATPLFTYVGRLKRYKTIETIIEAFALLLDTHPEARLVIAGDGDHRAALEHRAQASGAGHRIEFPGWLAEDDKWSLLASAWALCYTSPNEGWGLSSLEAQAVGTIALVSDTPGLRDTVDDGRSGWLVEHGSTTALASRMRWVIAEPEARRRMEVQAIERAAVYRWDSAASATLEVLEAAARGDHTP